MAAAPEATRRAFLRFLAASPLLPYLHLPRDWMTALAQEPDLIKAAKDALDVFDFEAVARRNLSPAHFGYLETGMVAARLRLDAALVRRGAQRVPAREDDRARAS